MIGEDYEYCTNRMLPIGFRASQFFSCLLSAEDQPTGSQPSDSDPGRGAWSQAVQANQQKRNNYAGGNPVSA